MASTNEERFWNWFQSSEDRLYHIERDLGPLMAELFKELGKVNEFISFEFGPIGSDGRRDFVLSSDGASEYFSAVEALHAAAPELPRWTIVRFRQRKELGSGSMTTIANGLVETGTVRYILATEGLEASIALFVPGADRTPDMANGETARLILQEAVGEKDYGRYVVHVSVSDVTHDHYGVAKPITDLPAEFDTALKN